MEETWKFVEEFPRYMVSSTGRVQNWATGVFIKPTAKRNGLLNVDLRDENNKIFTRSLARLVAGAFIQALDSQELVVTHINKNNADNRVSNLKICTKSDVRNRNVLTGNKRQRRVRIVETGQEFISVTSCARFLGVTRSAVSQVLLKKSPTAAGHRFEYADED